MRKAVAEVSSQQAVSVSKSSLLLQIGEVHSECGTVEGVGEGPPAPR